MDGIRENKLREMKQTRQTTTTSKTNRLENVNSIVEHKPKKSEKSQVFTHGIKKMLSTQARGKGSTTQTTSHNNNKKSIARTTLYITPIYERPLLDHIDSIEVAHFRRTIGGGCRGREQGRR